MNPLEVLAQARAASLTLKPNGDRLKVRGPQEALDAWRDTLREHKPAIMALLTEEAMREAREVAWRVAALRPHVARLGPLRLPPVRDGVPPLVSQDPLSGALNYGTYCASCGEPRESSQTYHCRPCACARQIVLLDVREGVTPPAPADGERQGAA